MLNVMIEIPDTYTYLGQDVDKCPLYEKAYCFMQNNKSIVYMKGTIIEKLIRKEVVLVSLGDPSVLNSFPLIPSPAHFAAVLPETFVARQKVINEAIKTFNWNTGLPSDFMMIRILTDPVKANWLFSSLQEDIWNSFQKQLRKTIDEKQENLSSTQKEIHYLKSFVDTKCNRCTSTS